MRIVISLLVLAGCPAGGAGANPINPNNPQSGCEYAGTEYIRATSGTFLTNQFLLDGQAILLDVNSVVTCVRTDGGGAAWFFQRNGSDYGMFRAEASESGAQPLDTNNFVLDLYGSTPTAVRFTGTEYNGTFNVTLGPAFNATARGTGGAGTRSLTLDVAATAVP